jgi:hypothetical protein
MDPDWHRLAVAADFDVAPDSLLVTMPNNRRHRVRVIPSDVGYRLEAIVARRRDVRNLGMSSLDAWELNRTSRLVGYQVDRRGRLIAHAWSPRAGMTKAMFQVMVRTLAQEADRRELLLTGADRE